MEYKITLKKIKPLRTGIILSLVLFSYVILRLVLDFGNESLWTYWYILFYLPVAVIFLLDGLGYTFGKGSININNEYISIASGIIFRKQKVNWNDISAIEMQKNRLYFRLKNYKNTFIQTTRIPDFIFASITKILKQISEEKGITFEIVK